MAENAGVSGRGNATIPIPKSPKDAPYVKQGQEDGTKYGTNGGSKAK